MLRFCWIIAIFNVTTSLGQTFENIRTHKDEDKIIIVYDLVSLDPGSKVIVSLYSSLDNFKSPLSNIMGDIGTVLPGPNKRITWNADESDLQKFEGITFQFKGEVVLGWRITNPSAKPIKRGKKNIVQWQGGKPDDRVTIQLIDPNQNIEELGQISNSGSFIWNTRKNIKVGKGYLIHITSGENSAEQRFTIVRKIPRVFYVVPVAGAAIFLLLLGDEDNGDGDLPDAPSPN